MKGRIGDKLKIFLLIATFTYISFDSVAQFYVGGKLCIGSAPPTTPTMPSTQSTDCVEPTVFFDTEKDATAWLWDFGDPTSTANTATIRNPQHFYATPGKYIVSLTRIVSGILQSPVTKEVTIGLPPQQPLFFKKKKLDTTICDGKTLKLDPYFLQATPTGAKFLWFPQGQTTQTIDVTKSGCYSVEVFDAAGGCSRTAQINVKFCVQPPASSGSEKWYFGKGATLDFQAQGSPQPPKDPLAETGDLFDTPKDENPVYVPITPTKSNPIDSPEGAAMAFDPSGTLVLYTDGVDIFGKDDKPLAAMPPLTDSKLGGTNAATQSAVIVPKGSCNECPHHLYYVYTINKQTGLLSYSIVDLRRNDGVGAVVEKDIPVSFQTSQRLTAMINQNETGFFIYSHDAGTNTFRILEIDSTGTKETIQNIGLAHSDAVSEQGYMRLSPTGAKMAVAVVKGGKNYIEIFDVDKATGRLGTLPLTIDIGIAAPPIIYGVEFSDDEQKLYVTLRGDPSKGETSYLYQLNLNLKNPLQIATDKKLIDKSTTLAFGALQSGPISGAGSKFIYMAIDGSQYLPYIMDPSAVGGASVVGYQPISGGFGADVLGASGFGFPNVIHAKPKQDGEGLSATYEGNCQGKPTIFKTEGICSPMKAEVEWDFGDGTTGTGTNPSHTYAQAGTYTVKLTVHIFSETEASKIIKSQILGNTLREMCNDFTVTDIITIKPSPIVNLADEAYVCISENETLKLDPKAQQTVNPGYLWNTTEKTPTVIANAAGVYMVTVSNIFSNSTRCFNSDKIEIKEGCEPRLFVPEIFTANNDGINDILQIPSAHITDFELRIFNRWGEIIFESKDPERIWDGSYKGQVIAPMMYAFVVSYKSSDFPEREKITRRGAIMLVN